MNAATLATVMGRVLPQARYEALNPGCNEAMIRANATTRNRASMWLAQIGHETGGLRWATELADGTRYDRFLTPNGPWRTLGNTEHGDGARFKGRGFIQVTGRGNFTRLSQWAFNQKLVPTRNFFVANPAALASDRYVWLGAVWFWTVERPILNQLADNRDVAGATRAIQGAQKHLAERRKLFDRALNMGARVIPERELTRAEVAQMIANAMRAHVHGGNYGRFTQTRYRGWVRPKSRGINPRLADAERRTT
jgi:predicted chitinase